MQWSWITCHGQSSRSNNIFIWNPSKMQIFSALWSTFTKRELTWKDCAMIMNKVHFFFTFILSSSITTKRVFLGKGVSSGLEPAFWVRRQGHMDPCVKSQHIAQSLHDTVRITFYPGSVRVNILCSNLEPTFLGQGLRTYQVIFV